MLTAYETLETARQALRLGAREYLNKPFDILTLRTSVAKAVERRRANVELKSNQASLAKLRKELDEQAPPGGSAGSIIHDLNNPLTVINSYVELINRQVQNASTLNGDELDRMKVGIACIHSQVGRCLEISRRYLGARRRQDSVSVDQVAVNEVLPDLHELLLKHPSAEGNELHIFGLNESLVVRIHATDLLRVLLNLTTNALQSTDSPHRVEVLAQPGVPNSDISTGAGGSEYRFIGRDNLDPDTAYAAITVFDTGPGIPANIVPRLFNEPLTTKPADKGHGLGLGSVKQLVFAARGAIRLTTKVGQGTQFTVFLPTAAAA